MKIKEKERFFIEHWLIRGDLEFTETHNVFRRIKDDQFLSEEKKGQFYLLVENKYPNKRRK